MLINSKVITINGKKNIKDIKVGDSVLSFNENKKINEYNKVLNAFSHITNTVIKIKLENDIIEVTEEHPFYNGQKYIKAKSLQIGDKVLSSNGNYYSIIEIEILQSNEEVYNIEVENNHNYFVGNLGILVHNYGSSGAGESFGGGGGSDDGDDWREEEIARIKAEIEEKEAERAKYEEIERETAAAKAEFDKGIDELREAMSGPGCDELVAGAMARGNDIVNLHNSAVDAINGINNEISSLCNQLSALGDYSEKAPQGGYDKYSNYDDSYSTSDNMMHVDSAKCEEALARLKNAEKIFEYAEYTLHGINNSSDRLGNVAQKDYNDLHLLPYKLELCLYNLQQTDEQFRIATDDLDKMSNALRNMNGADAYSLDQKAEYLMGNAVARLQERGRADEAEECMQKMTELHEQYHKHEITEEQFRAEAAYWVTYYSNFDKNKAEAIQNGDTYTPLDFYGNKILDADGKPIEMSFEDMSNALRDLTNNFAFTGLTQDGLDLAFSGDIARLWYGSELEAFNNGYSNSNYEFMQNLYNYVNNDLTDYFDTETFNAKCGWGHEGSETLTNNEIYKQYTLNGHQELLPDNLKGLNDCVDRLTTEGFLLGLNISGLDISKVKEMYADERIFVTDYQAMLTTAGILGINVEDIFWSKDKGYYVAPMNSLTNSESQQYNRSFANVAKNIDDLYNVALHSDDYRSGLEQEYNWHLFNDYVKIGEETINDITIPIYKLDENGNRVTVKKDFDDVITDEDGERFFNLSNGMKLSEQDIVDIFNGKTIDKFISKNPEGGIDVSFSFINNSQTKEVKDLLSKEFGFMSYNDSLLSLGSLKDMCDAIDSSGNINWQDVYTELKTEISELKSGATEGSNLTALGLDANELTAKNAIEKLQELMQDDKTKSSAMDLIKNLQSTYNTEFENRAGLLHFGDELSILNKSFEKGFKGAVEGIADAVAVQAHSDAALTFMDKLKQKFSGDSKDDSSFLNKVGSVLTRINPITSGIKNAEALGVGFLNLLGINHGIELKEDTILSMLVNSLSPELDSSNKYKDWKMQNPDSYLNGKYKFMQDSNAFASGFSNYIKSLPAVSRSQYEALYEKGFDYSKFSTDKLSEIYYSDKYTAHMKGDKNVSFTDEEMYYVHLLDNIDFSKAKEDMIFNDGLDMHIDNPNPTAADVASYAFSTLGAKVTNMVENAYEQYYYQQNGYMNLESIDRFEQAFSDYVLGIDTFNNYESIKNNTDIMNRAKTQYDVRENAIYDHTSEWWNNYKEKNARMYNYSSVQEDNFFFKANEQIGRMTPLVAANLAAMALSTLAPGASPVLAEAISTVGKVLFFESAYGDAASQAFREGASYSDAMNYALMSATLEEATEHMFTDIAGFSKVGENFLEKLASKAVDKLSLGLTEKTIAGKIAKDLIVAGFGEGMEEIVSDSVNPFLEALTYKKDQTGLDIYHEQVSTESLLNTFLISAFTGAVFQGAHLGGETLSLYNNVNNMNKDMRTVMEIFNKNDVRSKIANEIKNEVYKQLMLSDELSLNERYEVINNTINEISKKYESNPEMKDMLDEYKSFRDSYYTKTSELKVNGKTVAVVPSALANNVKSSMKIRDGLMKFNGSQIEFSNESVANLVINEMNRMSYELTEKMKAIISNPNIINDPILSEKIKEVYVPMQALPINKILSDSGIKSREALIAILKNSKDMTGKVQNQIKLLETQIKESNEAKNNPDYTTLVKAMELYDEIANIFEDKYDVNAIINFPSNIDVKEINNRKDGIHTYEISYVNENGENLKYTIQTLNNLQLDSRVIDKTNIAELLLNAIKNNQKYVEFVKNANGNIVNQVSNTLIQNRINEINDLLLKTDKKQELEKLQQEKQELNDLINDLINTDENFLHSYIDFAINQKSTILNQLNSLLKSSNDSIIKEKINEITDLLNKTEFEKILRPERIEVIEKNIKNLNKDSKAKIKNYKNMLKESRNALKNISEYHNQFFQAQEKFNELLNVINNSNNMDIKLSDIISFKMMKNASNVYNYIVTYTNDNGKTREYTFLSNNNLIIDLKYVDKAQLNDMIKEIVENNHKYVDFYFDKNGKLSNMIANDIIENQIKLVDKELTNLQQRDNERIFVDEEDTARNRIKELQREKAQLNDELQLGIKEKNTSQVQQIQQELTSDLKANVTENNTSTQRAQGTIIEDVTRNTVLQDVASKQETRDKDTTTSTVLATETATAAGTAITQATIQNIIEDAANNKATIELNVGETAQQVVLNIDEIRKNFIWQKNLLEQLKIDFISAISSQNIFDLKICIERMNKIFNEINNYIEQANKIIEFEPNSNIVKAISEFRNNLSELNRFEVNPKTISDISDTFVKLDESFEKVSNEFNKVIDQYNNEDINAVSPYEALRNNPNLEVKRVSDLKMNSMMDRGFNRNDSYKGYDYVISSEMSLNQILEQIPNNIDGKVLIEIKNTLDLNRDVISKIPSNVNVRITGSYTESFLQTFRHGTDAAVSLQNVTYTKEELIKINEILNEFDNMVDPNWSDIEKARFAFDYLSDRTRIDYKNSGEYEGNNQTRDKHFSSLIGLVDSVSTCQGFAHIYQALCERMGIECYELTGRLSVEEKVSKGRDSHAFNAVKIDGKTFLVDTVRADQHSPFNNGTGFGVKNIGEYHIDLYKNQAVTSSDINTYMDENGTMHDMKKTDNVVITPEYIKINDAVISNEEINHLFNNYDELQDALLFDRSLASKLFKAVSEAQKQGINYNINEKVQRLVDAFANLKDGEVLFNPLNVYDGNAPFIISSELVEKYGEISINVFAQQLQLGHGINVQKFFDFLNEESVKSHLAIFEDKILFLENGLPTKIDGVSLSSLILGIEDGNFPSVFNSQLQTLVRFIKENNVQTNFSEKVTNVINALKSVNQNELVINMQDVVNNGINPIIMPETITLRDGEIIKSKYILNMLSSEESIYISLKSKYTVINKDNIFEVLDNLEMNHPEVANFYKNQIELIDSIKDNYIYENGDTYVVLPKTIDKYNTSDLVDLMNYDRINASFINKVINSDLKTKKQVLKALEKLKSEINKSNPNLDVTIDSRVIEALNENKKSFEAIQSKLQGLLEQMRTNNFGARQSIVDELLHKVGVNNVVDQIFGKNVKTEEFMKILDELKISDEELLNLITKNYNDSIISHVYSKNMDIKVFNGLIEQVQRNFTDMSVKDAIKVLYLLESAESGGHGICNYATMANLIFQEYIGNEAKFSQDFGFDMYVETDAGRVLNDARLLVDIFTKINDGTLIKYENDNYIVSNESDYLNLASQWNLINTYLTEKGLDLRVNKSFGASTYSSIMEYNDIISKIYDNLKNGNNIMISSNGFTLIDSKGIKDTNVGAHIMTVVGIDSNGNLIVDSWGKRYTFNLREELQNSGNRTEKGSERYVTVQIFETNNNGITNSNTNSDIIESYTRNEEARKNDTKSEQNTTVVNDFAPRMSYESIDIMQNVFDTLEAKYGRRNALDTLAKYYDSQDIRMITRDNNARDLIQNVDRNSILEFINSISSGLTVNDIIYINNAIDNLTNIYDSERAAFAILRNYIQTGKINQSFYNYVKNISRNSLETYFKIISVNNSSNFKSNLEIRDRNVLDTMNSVFTTLEEKYGRKVAINTLFKYLNSNGNLTLITRDNNARGLIQGLSNNAIIQYVNMISSGVSYSDMVRLNSIVEYITNYQGSERVAYDILNNYAQNGVISSSLRDYVKNISRESISNYLKVSEIASQSDRTIDMRKEVVKVRVQSSLNIPVNYKGTINGFTVKEIVSFVKQIQKNGFVYSYDNINKISAAKTLTYLEDGKIFNKNDLRTINSLYNQYISEIVRNSIEPKLSKVYKDFANLGKKTSAFNKLREMGYSVEDVAYALLGEASSLSNYRYSRAYYNKAYDYLIDNGYNNLDAAKKISDIYKSLIELRGYDEVVNSNGITIRIIRGMNWNNQAYNISYIIDKLNSLKGIYKKSVPVVVNVTDTFNYDDKIWSINYKDPNFVSAATGGNGTINLYKNEFIDETVISHEYAHILDQMISKDNIMIFKDRFAETTEWKNAIQNDVRYPSEYAKTNSVEDFAESVAYLLLDPDSFRRKFPNRYYTLSKYLNLGTANNVVYDNQVNYAQSDNNQVYNPIAASSSTDEILDIDEDIVDNSVKNNTIYNTETQTLTIDGTEFTIERLEKLFERFGSDMTDYIRNGNIDGVDIIKFLKEVKKLQDTGAITIESSSINHLLNELNQVNENDYILNLVESYNKYVSFVTIDESLVNKYGIEFIENFKKDIIGELDNNISNNYYYNRLLFLQEESIKNNYELFENKILRIVDGLPYEFDGMSVKTMLSAIDNRTVASYYEDALIEFARYLSENNIEINASEYVLEALNKIKVPEGKYITNILDVVNDGANPIIIDSTIKIGNTIYQSKDIIKVLENEHSQLFVIMDRSYGILNQKNLTDVINKFMEQNPSLREIYSNSLELLNKINSSYIYKIDFSNYELLPSTFDNFRTLDLMEAIMAKDEGRTRLLNLDFEQRKAAVKAIENLEKYLKENNIKFEYDTKALKDELLEERKTIVEEIRSKLYEVAKNNLSKGNTFGVQQGKVYNVLKNLNVHNVLDSIFNVEMVDDNFLKGLEEANISAEEFREALLSYNNNSFAVPRFDFEDSLVVLNNLVNQVKSVYDGMTDIEAIKFLYLMESKEAGSRGICNYASFANLIFEKYIGNESKFLQDFGYPMYIETKNGRVLNDSQLLTDMYATINDGNLVKFENGKYVIQNTSNKYLNLASNPSLLNDFLAKKGIGLQLDLVTEQRTGILQTKQVTLHEDWLDIISNEIKNGNTVMLSSSGFNIYKPNGELFKNNVGGHIMTVVGISSNGNLIVDSWGMELEIDLRSELQHTSTTNGNSYLMIQSYRLVDGNAVTNTATHVDEVYDSMEDVEVIDASEETSEILTEEQIISRDLATLFSNGLNQKANDLLNSLMPTSRARSLTQELNTTNENGQKSAAISTKELNSMYDSNVRADKQVSKYLDKFASEYTLENKEKVREVYKYLKEKNPKAKIAEAIKEYYESKIKTREYTTYNYQGIDIKIPVDLNANSQVYTVEHIIEQLDSLLEMYGDVSLSEIVIHDTACPINFILEEQHGINNFEALGDTDGRTINLYATTKIDDMTLSHEYAHLISNELVKNNKDITSEWINAMNSDNLYVNEYASTNISEDFAESVAAYIESPSEFIENFPNRAAFIQKYVDTMGTIDVTKTGKVFEHIKMEKQVTEGSIGTNSSARISMDSIKKKAKDIGKQAKKDTASALAAMQIFSSGVMNSNAQTSLEATITNNLNNQTYSEEQYVARNTADDDIILDDVSTVFSRHRTIEEVAEEIGKILRDSWGDRLIIKDIQPIKNGYHIYTTALDLFVPENFEDVKDIDIYFQGSGGRGGEAETYIYNAIEESVLSENSDKIVLALYECSDHGYAGPIADILKPEGFEHYNLYGFSAGGDTSLYHLLSRLKQNPNLPPQVVCMLDTADNGCQLNLKEEDLAALKNNKTTVIMVEDTNPGNYAPAREQNVVKEMAKNADVIIATRRADHGDIAIDAFKQNLLGFINGNITKLNVASGEYTFEVYNKETGKFELISEEEAYDRIRNRDPKFEKSYEDVNNSSIKLRQNVAESDISTNIDEFSQELVNAYNNGLKSISDYLDRFASNYTAENMTKIEEIYKFLKEKNPDANVAEAIRDYYEAKVDERGFTSYEDNGVSIKVINNIDTNAQVYTVEYIRERLTELRTMYPSTNIDGVVIYDTACPSDMIFAEKYGIDGFRALADTDGKTVKLYATTEVDDMTLSHEYAHLIANDLISKNPNLSSEWINDMNADNAYVNEYASTSVEEDFAESVAAYVESPSEFIKNFPNRAIFIQKYVDINGKVDIKKVGKPIVKVEMKEKVTSGSINTNDSARISMGSIKKKVKDISKQAKKDTASVLAAMQIFSNGVMNNNAETSLEATITNNLNSQITREEQYVARSTDEDIIFEDVSDYKNVLNDNIEKDIYMDSTGKLIVKDYEIKSYEDMLNLVMDSEKLNLILDEISDSTKLDQFIASNIYKAEYLFKSLAYLQNNGKTTKLSINIQHVVDIYNKYGFDSRIINVYDVAHFERPIVISNETEHKYGKFFTDHFVNIVNDKTNRLRDDFISDFINNNMTELQEFLNEPAIDDYCESVKGNYCIYNGMIVSAENGIPKSLDYITEYLNSDKLTSINYKNYNDLMSYAKYVIENNIELNVSDSVKVFLEKISKVSDTNYIVNIENVFNGTEDIITAEKDNIYIAYDEDNKMVFLPKEFNSYPTYDIINILDNFDNAKEIISNRKVSDRKVLLEAIDEYITFLKDNNSTLFTNDMFNKKNEIAKYISEIGEKETNSRLQSLFEKTNDIDMSYGVNQAIVHNLIDTIGVQDVIEIIFGKDIKTEKFMEILEKMDFTEEEFNDALITYRNSNGILNYIYSSESDIKVFNDLVEQVQINCPGISYKDAVKFLFLLETEESRCGGICNYAVFANLIFQKYIGNEEGFLKDFGYPMYIETENGRVLNDARLLVDMFSNINMHNNILITNENGEYKVSNYSDDYYALSSWADNNYWQAVNDFLESKNIPFIINLNEKFSFFNFIGIRYQDEFNHEQLLSKIRYALKNNEVVMLSLLNPMTSAINSGHLSEFIFKGAHIMTIVGIDSNERVIVSSWGEEYKLDLKTIFSENKSMETRMNIEIFNISGTTIDDNGGSHHVGKFDTSESIQEDLENHEKKLLDETEVPKTVGLKNSFSKTSKKTTTEARGKSTTSQSLINIVEFKRELNKFYDPNVRVDKQVSKYLDKFASEYTLENKEKVREVYKYLKEKNPKAKIAEAIKEYYESKIKTREYTTYNYQGIDIKIPVDLNVNSQVYTVEHIIEQLDSLLEMYGDVNLSEIVIHDTACPINFILEEQHGINNFEALGDTDGRTINLYATTKIDDMTLSHEYAHLISNELVKNNKDITSEWINAMNSDNLYVNEYASTNISEDFAESVAAYIESPSEFIKNFSNRAIFIQKYVDINGKVDIKKVGKSLGKVEMHEKVTSGNINTNSSARGILSKLFGLNKYLNSSDQEKYDALGEFDSKSKIKLIASMQDREIFIKSLDKLESRKDIVSLLNNLKNDEFKSLIIDKLSNAKATEQLTKLAVNTLSNNGIDCPISGNNKTLVPDNYNEYGIKNAKKYEFQLSVLSEKWGIAPSEVQTVIEEKLKEFMDNCMFGRRVKSIEGIIKSGVIFNQFQSGSSSGQYDPYHRVKFEQSLFGVGLDVTNGDRPIYGMLFPENVEANYDYFFKYTGPGYFYNGRSGCILVFDKEKILKNTTFTIGDSLAYSTDVMASRVDDPKFFGIGNQILYKKLMSMSLENFRKCQLKDIFYDNNNCDYCNDYIELQIYGFDMHKIDVIKEVLFNIPPTAVEQELLEKNGIAWRVLN